MRLSLSRLKFLFLRFVNNVENSFRFNILSFFSVPRERSTRLLGKIFTVSSSNRKYFDNVIIFLFLPRWLINNDGNRFDCLSTFIAARWKLCHHLGVHLYVNLINFPHVDNRRKNVWDFYKNFHLLVSQFWACGLD